MLGPAAQEQVCTFDAFTTGHPNLLRADAKVRAFVDAPAGSAVLLTFGPTGAGKTTLVRRVAEKITEQQAEALALDPQRHPPLVFDCPASTGGNFSWSEFLIRGLEALLEPAAASKRLVPEDPKLPIDRARLRNVGDLRRAFVGAVRARRPAAIFVDEASQLTGVGSGQRLLAQLDFIKSLADATESVFVLAGTYELQALRNLSGQLGRRCQEVHFERYRLDDPADQRTFASVLKTFARELPMDGGLVLADPEWVYLRTAGCVGTLKQWLLRALAAALEEGTEIKRRHLEATALSVHALQAIAAEIQLGENALRETPEAFAELERLLGWQRPRVAPPARPRTGRRPQRAPGRDPVGFAA
ncbi:MAG TPA: ATP-binding protein [Candidatus Limnocylindrales bacterium]|nr:ATP-binding protein [Candidatus Limnocylindrales bacterium]